MSFVDDHFASEQVQKLKQKKTMAIEVTEESERVSVKCAFGYIYYFTNVLFLNLLKVQDRKLRSDAAEKRMGKNRVNVEGQSSSKETEESDRKDED